MENLKPELVSMDEAKNDPNAIVMQMDKDAIPNLEEQLLAAISMIPQAEPAIKTNVGAFVSTKMVLPIMIVAD